MDCGSAGCSQFGVVSFLYFALWVYLHQVILSGRKDITPPRMKAWIQTKPKCVPRITVAGNSWKMTSYSLPHLVYLHKFVIGLCREIYSTKIRKRETLLIIK